MWIDLNVSALLRSHGKEILPYPTVTVDITGHYDKAVVFRPALDGVGWIFNVLS